MPAVRQELGLEDPEGCHYCRPALNFYLLCDWPGDYLDDAQSRFINERATPTSRRTARSPSSPGCGAASRRRRSCAPSPTSAEKYYVPMVKVTGGQRIDLLGVRKEDLPGCGPTSSAPASSPATPTPRGCAR